MLKSTNISNYGYTGASPFRGSGVGVFYAQGNILATYTKDGSNEIKLGEYNLYGSSRLGTASYNTTMSNLSWQNSGIYSRTLGLKRYEISNHLGNVLTVFSDKKITLTNNHTTPYILSTTDYDPFGMIMNGRDWNAGEYRFGFNGKENDNEVKGVGNQQDYGFRIYDPRIGKFLSVDPLTKSYPWYTPYQFAGNKPIWAVDLDGLEEYYYYLWFNRKSQVYEIDNFYTIYERINEKTGEHEKINVEEYFLLEDLFTKRNIYKFSSKKDFEDFNPNNKLDLLLKLPQDAGWTVYDEAINEIDPREDAGAKDMLEGYKSWRSSEEKLDVSCSNIG